MSLTQLNRPSLYEAWKEAYISPDSHWTANLSRMGITRIALGKMGSIATCECGREFYEGKCSSI